VDYSYLLPFCKTDKERRYVSVYADGINKRVTHMDIAKSLKIDDSTLRRCIRRVKERASLQGVNPETQLDHKIADTHILKGTSTLYGKDGEKKLEWVKTTINPEEITKMISATVDAFKDDIPKNPITYVESDEIDRNDNLMNLHVLADYHIGMFSWGELNGTGDDWNSETSERFIIEWFKQSIASAPNARVGVLLNLGDLLSSDSVDPVTPASKHLLDIDVKFQQMIRMTIRVIRQIVEMMRTKYEEVRIVTVAGNHDFSSSMWMKEFLFAHYESCDDVIVDNSADIYHAIEHGDVAIFSHHGHKRGMRNVSDVFVAKFRELYGRTKFAYAHLGHLHHQDIKENNLMVVEQHRTMIAPDAYSTNGGYMGGRSAYVITYHKNYGEVSRINIGAEMINI